MTKFVKFLSKDFAAGTLGIKNDETFTEKIEALFPEETKKLTYH